MNNEEFRQWQDAVMEHSRMMDSLVDDRIAIKELMIEHLKQFFDYDEIVFDDKFNKITLKWEYKNDPVIMPEKLVELGMDFIISHDYSEALGHGVMIELYPFGLPKDGDIVD